LTHKVVKNSGSKKLRSKRGEKPSRFVKKGGEVEAIVARTSGEFQEFIGEIRDSLRDAACWAHQATLHRRREEATIILRERVGEKRQKIDRFFSSGEGVCSGWEMKKTYEGGKTAQSRNLW